MLLLTVVVSGMGLRGVLQRTERQSNTTDQKLNMEPQEQNMWSNNTRLQGQVVLTDGYLS